MFPNRKRGSVGIPFFAGAGLRVSADIVSLEKTYWPVPVFELAVVPPADFGTLK